VTSLATGECVEGLLLAPSGEVVTSLWCREHPEGIDLVVRAEVIDHTLGALRRFLLRTQCVLEAAHETAGPYATVGEQVRRGAPGPAEFALGLAAHSFGRAFVASHVSLTKGCFTGQELVGRLDARGGNVPFRLARMTGEDEAKMDQLARSAGPRGERALQGLTTAVRDHAVTALAVVHRTLVGADTDVMLEGVHVELLHGEDTLGR
jgi:folate-binding Fe-S cluster repair protein YgfZ